MVYLHLFDDESLVITSPNNIEDRIKRYIFFYVIRIFIINFISEISINQQYVSVGIMQQILSRKIITCEQQRCIWSHLRSTYIHCTYNVTISGRKYIYYISNLKIKTKSAVMADNFDRSASLETKTENI